MGAARDLTKINLDLNSSRPEMPSMDAPIPTAESATPAGENTAEFSHISNAIDDRLVRIYKISGKIFFCLAALIAATVLIGWIIDSQTLKTFLVGSSSFKTNAAIATLMECIALYFLYDEAAPRSYRIAGKICALVSFFIGFYTLLEHLIAGIPSIDQLLFSESFMVFPPANRMPPNPAFAHTLIGLALFFLDYEKRHRRHPSPSQYLILAASLVPLFSFAGYLYGLEVFYFFSLTLHATIALLFICAATMFSRPARGFMILFSSQSFGGDIARKLLIVAVLVPLILGKLRLMGEHAGFYETEAGVTLAALFNIIILAVVVWRTAFSLHLMDIERRNLVEEVGRHAQALANANKELEAFSYSVSHDLRAPLRSIDGFSKKIMSGYQARLDDQGKDYLNRVRAGAQKMGKLIDDMLSLSRVSRSKMIDALVDMSVEAKRIIEDLKESDPARKVNFVVADGLRAHADPDLVRILLQNLFSNAWKFTSKKDDPIIEFGSIKNQNQEVFFVRDTGAGFDMAYSDKLFNPFQRLHSDSEFEGTGIGLATVKRILYRHGGRVWAEARLGEGATFYFTFKKGD